MPAATILNGPAEPHVMGIEVVQLEVTDGETYLSQRFSTITKAIASGNEDVDAHINVTFSGATATINYAAQTDKKVTLLLFGLT